MTAVAMLPRETDVKPPVLRKTRPIVIASDGSAASLNAFTAARLINSRTGCSVRVVSVLEPLPDVIPPLEGALAPVEWDEVRQKNQTELVSTQLKTAGLGPDCPVDIVFGRPCEVVAAYARAHNAGLILVGSNKHSVIGRILGEETAVDIARLSDVPMFVVSSSMKRLPKRIIIAMSLDPAGMQSTGETLALIADSPSVSCVHVQPRDEFLGVDWGEYDADYQIAMNERFASVEKGLLSAGLRPDLIFLHGNPAKEIVDFASYSKAELVVLDIKRRIGRTRAIGGRVARNIIRHVECGVLVVPNILPRSPGEKLPGRTEVLPDARAWPSAMRDFTTRNAGRIVTLEVDDPEVGAIVEARNYPLIGIDYDHRDDCFTVSLGEMHGMERHLTRTIRKPKMVSILTGDRRDAALSISHNGGQTLITF